MELLDEVGVLLLNVGRHDLGERVPELHLALALSQHVLVDLAFDEEGHRLILALGQLVLDLWMLHGVGWLSHGAIVGVGEILQLLCRHTNDLLGGVLTQELNVDALAVVKDPHAQVVCQLACLVVFLAPLAVVARNIIATTKTIVDHFLFTLGACFVPDLAT